MKRIDEINIIESLEKAKDYLNRNLKKYTQGFEIYIDNNELIISVDELIQNGAEYPELDKFARISSIW